MVDVVVVGITEVDVAVILTVEEVKATKVDVAVKRTVVVTSTSSMQVLVMF